MKQQKETPLVSIIMPCKNAALYLDECVQSIVNQTYSNWELIVINDHSTDHSSSILEEWSAKNSSIVCLQNKGNGIIEALRLALTKSKGEMITRMDADDIMSPNKLEIMVDQLTKSGEGHIATGSVKYFRKDKPLGNGYKRYAEWLNSLSIAGNNFNDIYKECTIPSPCWMMYRSDLMSIGAFDSNRYPEDYDLAFRMYQHQICVIPSSDLTLHLWRDHGDRASRNDENYKDNRFLSLKIEYFTKLDYIDDQPLVLWGAGTKGKLIAQELIQRDINFDWITDNSKKIGHNIYGKELKSTYTLDSMSIAQVIIAVANPIEQNKIDYRLNKLKAENKSAVYWFC